MLNQTSSESDSEEASFDQVLRVNNISAGSSDGGESENERASPVSVIEVSKDTIKYNIVKNEFEEEEKISNIPSKRLGSPRSRRPYFRSDFGRVSDVSFISSLESDDEVLKEGELYL